MCTIPESVSNFLKEKSTGKLVSISRSSNFLRATASMTHKKKNNGPQKNKKDTIRKNKGDECDLCLTETDWREFCRQNNHRHLYYLVTKQIGFKCFSFYVFLKSHSESSVPAKTYFYISKKSVNQPTYK